MIGEDFSRYALQAKKIPISMFWLGTIDPLILKESQTSGKTLPPLHSSTFSPAAEPAIKTGIAAMSAAAISILK
jgi:hippurate hydrolase